MQQPPAPQGEDSSGHQAQPVESRAVISTAAPMPASAAGVPDLDWTRGDLPVLWARYSPEEVRAGLQVVEAAAAAEPRVTPLLRASVQTSGARLEALQSRVKSPAAMVETIHQQLMEVAGAGVDVAAVAQAQPDGLRYVVVCPEDQRFAEVVQAVAGSLEAVGGSVVSMLDLFRPGAGYQGLHLVLRLSAVSMEVRFHSAVSWQAWMRSKTAYEVVRDPDQSGQRREWAMTEARVQFQGVVPPAGLAGLAGLSGIEVKKQYDEMTY